MAVRKLKPVTPGQRHKVIGTFEDITASVPEKSLVYGKRSTGGRNNTGKMTVRYIGGGHKQKYRLIDFKREKDGVPAVVKTIEYDPNRSARIALLFYADGENVLRRIEGKRAGGGIPGQDRSGHRRLFFRHQAALDSGERAGRPGAGGAG